MKNITFNNVRKLITIKLILSLFVLIISCKNSNSLSKSTEENINVKDSTAREELIPIKIGTQIWATKNLNVTNFRNGDPITNLTEDSEWKYKFPDGGAWCDYENDPSNGKTYGKLYSWFAVNDPRGLAPKGWHIPSTDEWQTLVDYLGSKSLRGNEFKALNGGFRDGTKGGFGNMSYFAAWWTSTEWDKGQAYVMFLREDDTPSKEIYYTDWGFSVRCIKD